MTVQSYFEVMYSSTSILKFPSTILNKIVGGTMKSISLNHTAAILFCFVFVHRKSFPNISTRGSGYEMYCLWPIWPPRE